jgi:hypothetical protein
MPNHLTSFYEFYKIIERETPKMISGFKCAQQLYITFNECVPVEEWT